MKTLKIVLFGLAIFLKVGAVWLVMFAMRSILIEAIKCKIKLVRLARMNRKLTAN